MAAYFPNLSREHYSLYTVPGAFLLALAPRLYTMATYKQTTGKAFDAKSPHAFLPRQLEPDVTLDAETRGRLERAEGAQANGFENLGFFAAAIAAGNAAGLSPGFLNTISFAYIANRVVYNFLYIYGTTNTIAFTRTYTWLGSMALVSSVFVAAANKLRKPLLV